MTKVGFPSPAPITYNPEGSFISVVNGYSDIFQHKQQQDCPLTECVLKKPGCMSSFDVPTDLKFGAASPYALTAKETKSAGFLISLCY